uniref:Uncharacterized protein n=1 Tax=Glossina austeni TaxID=7395 RepID=A0A1A9VBD3_GLOAU
MCTRVKILTAFNILLSATSATGTRCNDYTLLLDTMIDTAEEIGLHLKGVVCDSRKRGCACADDNYKLDADLEAYSVKHPRRQATYKRNYCYDSSSGVARAQSNPAGRDITPRNGYRSDDSKALESEKQTSYNVFPMCDDFHELAAIQQQCLQETKLFDHDSEDTTDVSTITNSRLLRAQEISENISIDLAAATLRLPLNRVETAECTKPRTKGLMPKFSSHICQKRSPASNKLCIGGRRSVSYEEWINNLEDSSRYRSHNNVAQTSEALRGRCSSLEEVIE